MTAFYLFAFGLAKAGQTEDGSFTQFLDLIYTLPPIRQWKNKAIVLTIDTNSSIIRKTFLTHSQCLDKKKRQQNQQTCTIFAHLHLRTLQ